MNEVRIKSRRLVAIACLLGIPAAFADDSASTPAAFADDPAALVAIPVTPVEVRELPAVSVDGLPSVSSLNLSLPTLVAKAPGKKGKAFALKLSPPAASTSNSLLLAGGPVALDLKVPAAKDLSSAASLKLNLPDGAVKAQASASVGREDGQTAFWHKDAANLEAQISGPMGTALNVSGENKLSLTYRAPESVGAADGPAHVVRSESQSGQASMTLPLAPFQVTVGGNSTSEHTQEGAPGNAASFTQSAVRTADHTAYVDVEWQPLAGVQLKGGTAARVANISWQDAHSSSYRSVNPHLTATVTPFRDTTVTAKVEQVVAPFDAAAFANYTKADSAANASGFQPDHAWQLQTRVEQRVGPASVSATYTKARQGTVTEFAEVEGVQAPATTPLLGRDSVAVAVNLPLAAVGLPHTDLTSEATWQSSRVVDPVTFETRAASGEPAQKVSLRLAHSLPSHNLSIGVTGEFTGERTSYQVKELSTTAASGSVGAFVSYKPGAYEVDLNVSGLYGSSTRDDFYHGTRGASLIDRSSVQDNSGPTLKLELKRPF